MMKGIITKGTVCTIDEEIEMIEGLIDAGRIEQMLTIGVERIDPMLLKVHTLTCGCPLDKAREIFELAIKSIDDMIGPKKA